MKKILLSASLGLIGIISMASTPQGGVIDVGDTASFSFRGPLVNGMGLKSLDDLRGKPVLVDFWGTR
jgi:hypothetical protein